MRSLFRYLICLWVVALLFGCSHNKAEMLSQLEELEAVNRSGQPLLNDTLAESLVEYFDRHGDSNERMRAKYMLGRTYFCMGELPRALEMYNEASDCADTTDADCDFAKLSRVYAQKDAVYHKQLQPQSELQNLRYARHLAIKAKDTLMAIECDYLIADVYKILGKTDSVIMISEDVINNFREYGRADRASQVAGSLITAMIKYGNLRKAHSYMEEYEKNSGFFDHNGEIESGRELYYYSKGMYYIAIHELDSAEMVLRKELAYNAGLNNQLAACKGLLEVFKERKNLDSIIKYSDLVYELNDSSYSHAEIENLQKLNASYNYNHAKYLSEKKSLEGRVAMLIALFISFAVILIFVFFCRRYNRYRKSALDDRLRNAEISRYFRDCAKCNPPISPTFKDWSKLRALVENEIPSFRRVLKVDELSLSEFDYDVCLMIRVFLLPKEMSTLKQCSPSLISKTRKRLLGQIFGQDGNSDDFDDEIRGIVD